ncbi:MAG: branched-chain amino acid ABC transporter permease, partial [Myxococcales bacterium]
FMAVGGYTATYVTVYHGRAIASLLGMSMDGAGTAPVMLVSLAAGAVASAVAGLAVGIPSLRLRGDYLAIVTLGFGEIIRLIFNNWRALGGATGYSGERDLGLPIYTNFFWVATFVVLITALIGNLTYSSYGRALRAIREDEIAAEAMGVDTTRAKLRAFVLASLFPAVAGGLYAFRLSYVDPSSAFPAAYEIQVILMAIFGGAGTVFGPLAGGILLAALGEALWARFAELHLLLFGLIIVIVLRYMPEGLLALLRRRVA